MSVSTRPSLCYRGDDIKIVSQLLTLGSLPIYAGSPRRCELVTPPFPASQRCTPASLAYKLVLYFTTSCQQRSNSFLTMNSSYMHPVCAPSRHLWFKHF